jgi:hypothetical protein
VLWQSKRLPTAREAFVCANVPPMEEPEEYAASNAAESGRAYNFSTKIAPPRQIVV